MNDMYVTDSNGKRCTVVTILVDHATSDSGMVTLYNDDPKYWCTVMGMFTESIHQDFDGWLPEEKKVIQAYLLDIITECNNELGLQDVEHRVGTEGGQE